MNLISQKCQSKKPFSSCNSKKKDSKNSTLATMVDEYLEEYGNCYQSLGGLRWIFNLMFEIMSDAYG
jgi:hypothetical protein